MNSSILKLMLLSAVAVFTTVGISACGKPVEKILVEETSTKIEEPQSVQQASVDELIAQAEASYAEAVTMSHAWTTTRTLIDKASAALKAGDSGSARALAEQALATAIASVEQGRVEAQAWQSRVPH
jgi:hypothetical protein